MSQKLAVHERIHQTVEKLTEQYTQQHEANLAEERLAEEIMFKQRPQPRETTFTSVEQQKLSEKAKEITDRLDDIQTRLRTRKAFPQITRC